MRKHIWLYIVQEIVWILIALLVAAFAVFPLVMKLNYVFLVENVCFAFYAVTLVRLVVFFKSVPWLKPTWVRFLLFVVNINLFIFIVRKEQNFISIYDSFTIEDLGMPRKTLSLKEMETLYNYFYTEINLVVVTCLILILAFCARLVLSYWSLAKTRLYVDEK